MPIKKDKILSTSINKKTSILMDDFNSSIDVDQRLIQEDISVTRAHVDALFKLGVITKSDLAKINKGLSSIQKDFDQKKIKFTKQNEDIHMNI